MVESLEFHRDSVRISFQRGEKFTILRTIIATVNSELFLYRVVFVNLACKYITCRTVCTRSGRNTGIDFHRRRMLLALFIFPSTGRLIISQTLIYRHSGRDTAIIHFRRHYVGAYATERGSKIEQMVKDWFSLSRESRGKSKIHRN